MTEGEEGEEQPTYVISVNYSNDSERDSDTIVQLSKNVAKNSSKNFKGTKLESGKKRNRSKKGWQWGNKAEDIPFNLWEKKYLKINLKERKPNKGCYFCWREKNYLVISKELIWSVLLPIGERFWIACWAVFAINTRGNCQKRLKEQDFWLLISFVAQIK